MTKVFLPRIKLLAFAPLAVLAACTAPEPAARPAAVAAPPPVIRSTGPDSVMGKTASALQSLFGRPTLDIEEGYARKLQFANDSCVLDAYLYPPAAGRDAVVTHIDARLPDGRDYDRTACITSLSHR